MDNITFCVSSFDVFKESYFYLNWALKTKNLKTKRKLLIKAKKELKQLSKEEINKRISKNLKVKH